MRLTNNQKARTNGKQDLKHSHKCIIICEGVKHTTPTHKHITITGIN